MTLHRSSLCKKRLIRHGSAVEYTSDSYVALHITQQLLLTNTYYLVVYLVAVWWNCICQAYFVCILYLHFTEDIVYFAAICDADDAVLFAGDGDEDTI